MSFAERVIIERRRLAETDPGGEREAIRPIYLWEPGVDELALVIANEGSTNIMEPLERIAQALEHIALILTERNVELAKVNSDIVKIAEPWRPHAEWVGTIPAGVVAETCRLHGKPFREGKYGWYCPTPIGNGKWCQEKPSTVVAVGEAALP